MKFELYLYLYRFLSLIVVLANLYPTTSIESKELENF